MSVTVSSKYQVVIPKNVRKQLHIKPGQQLNIRAGENGQILLEKTAQIDIGALAKKYAGSQEGIWHQQGLTADEWLRRERASWDK
jgi:AbrB family looped-hinge helix DNA binding protein